jgi:hypothetical protein
LRKPTIQRRLKAKKRNQAILVGMTWYNEEAWAEVKATATDPERFEASFPEWKAMAVETRRDLQRSGVLAVECLIVPQEFFDWCVLYGNENDAVARAEFVSEILNAARGA